MSVLSAVEYQGFWGSIGDLIWWFLSLFILLTYIMAVFSVIADLFRDRNMGGFAKVIWVLFLVFVPFLSVLVYLIARGRGMAERSASQMQQMKQAQDSYIQEVAGTSPADQIARAKELLDAGTISQEEFDKLKARALS